MKGGIRGFGVKLLSLKLFSASFFFSFGISRKKHTESTVTKVAVLGGFDGSLIICYSDALGEATLITSYPFTLI